MTRPAVPEDATLVLADNGSSRPDSTLRLRRIAASLSEVVHTPVHPVSLQHSDAVPAADLEGLPADTLEPFIARRVAAGDRRFLILPLFFGPSRALSDWIPARLADCQAATGRPLRAQIAPPLCPLPEGEPRLVAILKDQLMAEARRAGVRPQRIVLVDHGSPNPQVTAVRRWLAEGLRADLVPGTAVHEAVMERRAGSAYDFNGERLEPVLERLAREPRHGPVFLSLLFLAAGRHAGEGGDIDQIRRHCEAGHPGLRTLRAGLVGEHPGLVEVLVGRLDQALASEPCPIGTCRPTARRHDGQD